MRAENRPLECAKCLPVVTTLRAISVKQCSESLTAVGSRENGGEELGGIFLSVLQVLTKIPKKFCGKASRELKQWLKGEHGVKSMVVYKMIAIVTCWR